jgi:hypothetical protein
MRRFKGECAQFSFTRCPIYTHDGASAKFSTNSQETDSSALLVLVIAFPSVEGLHWSAKPRFEPGSSLTGARRVTNWDTPHPELRRTLRVTPYPESYPVPWELRRTPSFVVLFLCLFLFCLGFLKFFFLLTLLFALKLVEATHAIKL